MEDQIQGAETKWHRIDDQFPGEETGLNPMEEEQTAQTPAPLPPMMVIITCTETGRDPLTRKIPT